MHNVGKMTPRDMDDIHADARAVFRLAGLCPAKRASIGALALCATGAIPRIVDMAPAACLARDDRGWQIFVRRGLTPQKTRWKAAHELAHWYYQREGYGGARLEERCDALGAALVVPQALMRCAQQQYGADIGRLARALKASESLTLLRVAETGGVPTVLVKTAPSAPATRITRGGAYAWGSIPDRWVRTIRIHDEPHRLGLVVCHSGSRRAHGVPLALPVA